MYAPGTVIAGKYRVEHVVGRGGMGVVVAATHLQLGNQVALKILDREMAERPTVVERFMREARAAAQLHGDNVCRVSDVGMLDTGVPFIVMELLHGRDLSSVVKTNGALGPEIAVELVLQAGQALAEAHALGIVHRDVKPGNLFLTQRPNGRSLVKVLDFGIAKVESEQDFDLTRTSGMMGSPGYMSPEQLRSSRNVDARADIWSLGVVLYELVSGTKPFLGESITELALRVVTEPHPPLPASVRRDLVAVIERCLEKEPGRRYPDIAALAAALAPFTPGGPELARETARALFGTNQPAAAPPPGPTTPTTLGSASGMVEGHPRSRLPIIAGVAVGLVAIGAVALVAMRREPTPEIVVKPLARPAAAADVAPTPDRVAPVEPAVVEHAETPAPVVDAGVATGSIDAAVAPQVVAAPKTPPVTPPPPPKKKPTLEDLGDVRK